eukprot:TRINITY_DN4802_c0_g1_i3.p1 TRINITY_DN4802_c0_g1~~TRINITY_DN4802_c0_g1_i3.p1  ORF type:complete len:183 (+),score=49.87 TRINITY_DN4802_c0_g1_i3:155-703(+)
MPPKKFRMTVRKGDSKARKELTSSRRSADDSTLANREPKLPKSADKKRKKPSYSSKHVNQRIKRVKNKLEITENELNAIKQDHKTLKKDHEKLKEILIPLEAENARSKEHLQEVITENKHLNQRIAAFELLFEKLQLLLERAKLWPEDLSFQDCSRVPVVCFERFAGQFHNNISINLPFLLS